MYATSNIFYDGRHSRIWQRQTGCRSRILEKREWLNYPLHSALQHHQYQRLQQAPCGLEIRSRLSPEDPLQWIILKVPAASSFPPDAQRFGSACHSLSRQTPQSSPPCHKRCSSHATRPAWEQSSRQ